MLAHVEPCFKRTWATPTIGRVPCRLLSPSLPDVSCSLARGVSGAFRAPASLTVARRSPAIGDTSVVGLVMGSTWWIRTLTKCLVHKTETDESHTPPRQTQMQAQQYLCSVLLWVCQGTCSKNTIEGAFLLYL